MYITGLLLRLLYAPNASTHPPGDKGARQETEAPLPGSVVPAGSA